MAKHKYIKTPRVLYALFELYKTHVEENPRKVTVFGGRDFDSRENKLQCPLTFAGFDVFVMNHQGIKSLGVEQYFTNQDKLYDDYIGICARIKKEIRADQIAGGMVGQYNPSITQRLNSLAENTINTTTEQPLFGEDE